MDLFINTKFLHMHGFFLFSFLRITQYCVVVVVVVSSSSSSINREVDRQICYLYSGGRSKWYVRSIEKMFLLVSEKER